MFGDVGCGKSVVTSYVEDYIGIPLLDNSGSLSAPILAYYCKTEEKMPLCSVYAGLIWQLARNRPSLISQFREWYGTSSLTYNEDVLKDAGLLRGFL